MDDLKIKQLRQARANNEDVEKSLDDKPSVAGTYNISIENVSTTLPMFLTFDGENWTDLGLAKALAGGDTSKITYWDKPCVQNKTKLSY